jgi:hypothetical protein
LTTDNKWEKAASNHTLSQLQNSKNPPNIAASIIVKDYTSEKPNPK